MEGTMICPYPDKSFTPARYGSPFLILVLILSVSGCNRSSSPTQPPVGSGNGGTLNVLYLSPQGNDQNDGRSRESPLKTLARALQLARAGDTIIVLPGTYSESLESENIGFDEGPITIRGDSSGSRPVFDGNNRMSLMWRCFRCKRIVLENLEIRNYRSTAISFWQSHHITLRNLRFVNVARELGGDENWVAGGSSAIAFGDEAIDITVENNVVENSGYRKLTTDEAGMLINCWRCKDATFRNNTVRNYEGVGILIEEACRVTVENNTAENGRNRMEGWWTSGFWVDGGKGIEIRNNTFQDNEGPGIQVSDTEVAYPRGLSRNYRLVGNVSTRNKYGIYIWNFGQCPPPDDAVQMQDNRFENNTDRDRYCVEWECGVNQPCVESSPPDVDCGA